MMSNVTQESTHPYNGSQQNTNTPSKNCIKNLLSEEEPSLLGDLQNDESHFSEMPEDTNMHPDDWERL